MSVAPRSPTPERGTRECASARRATRDIAVTAADNTTVQSAALRPSKSEWTVDWRGRVFKKHVITQSPHDLIEEALDAAQHVLSFLRDDDPAMWSRKVGSTGDAALDKLLVATAALHLTVCRCADGPVSRESCGVHRPVSREIWLLVLKRNGVTL